MLWQLLKLVRMIVSGKLDRDTVTAIIDGRFTLNAQIGASQPYRDPIVLRQPPMTRLVLGDRVYALLSFLRGNETSVIGHVMIRRAREMDAHLGEDDYRFFVEHRGEIPVEFRKKIAFVFTEYRNPDSPGSRVYLYWDDDNGWIEHWLSCDDDWNGNGRLPRRE